MLRSAALAVADEPEAFTDPFSRREFDLNVMQLTRHLL
jgi:hypothetical protein